MSTFLLMKKQGIFKFANLLQFMTELFEHDSVKKLIHLTRHFSKLYYLMLFKQPMIRGKKPVTCTRNFLLCKQFYNFIFPRFFQRRQCDCCSLEINNLQYKFIYCTIQYALQYSTRSGCIFMFKHKSIHLLIFLSKTALNVQGKFDFVIFQSREYSVLFLKVRNCYGPKKSVKI